MAFPAYRGNAKVRAEGDRHLFPARFGTRPDALEAATASGAPRSGFERPDGFHEPMKARIDEARDSMKRALSLSGGFSSARPGIALGMAVALPLCLALPARADDKKSDARDQFERAVGCAPSSKATLRKDRSLADYKQTVAAYHKVYLISAQSRGSDSRADRRGRAVPGDGPPLRSQVFSVRDRRLQLSAEAISGQPLSRRGAVHHRANSERRSRQDRDDATASFQEYLKRFPALGAIRAKPAPR